MLVGEVFARMGLDTTQYEKNLDRAEKLAQKKAATIGGILKGALSVTLGMGMFEAIQRGFQAVVGEAVNFNSMMEQAQIGFTTMLGSAEKAQAFLDNMADFAARTPFEFPDLLESSKRMLAMGFAAGDILPMMEAVGNAAAGLGLGRDGINRITLALGQMRAKAKVSGEEMRQLTEAGVPAWDMLAEAMNMTTAEVMKMSEKGLIPADKAIKIMVEGMNKRFPDMMKNMENTWRGVTSTIKDVWRMTMGALTSGLFKGLTTWLQGVRDWATDFYNTFRQFGLQVALTKSFGAEFATMVNIVRSAVSAIVKHLSWWYKVLRQNWGMVKFVTTALLIYAAATKTAAIASGAFHLVTLALNGQLAAKIPLLSTVSTAVGIYRVQMHLAAMQGIVLTGVLAKLRVALYSLWTALGPIGWAIIAISLALGAGISIWSKYKSAIEQTKLQNVMANVNKQIEDFGKSTETATDGTNELANATEKAGKAANNNLQSFDEVHQLMEDTADASMDAAAGLDLSIPETKGLDEVFELGVPDMSNIQASWKEILSAIWQDIKEGFGNIWKEIKAGAVTAWNAITGAIKTIWTGFVNLTRPIWEPVASFLSALWSVIKSVAETIWNIIVFSLSFIWFSIVEIAKTVWSVLGPFFTALWEGIKIVAEIIWNGLKAFLTTIWSGIVAIGQAIWSAIGPFITTIWEGIKKVTATVWNFISTFLTTLWQGLLTTVTTIWNMVFGIVSTIWNAIRDTAVSIWNSIKEAVENPVEAARQAVQAISQNLKDSIHQTWDAILKKITDLKGTLYRRIIEPWEDAKKKIANIAEEAKEWGKNLINNFVDGIKESIKTLKSTLTSIGGTIKNYLTGSSSISVSYGNFSGAGSSSLAGAGAVPKLASGTNYIPQDMLAYLHEGEAVVPKEYNPAAGSISMEALEQAVYRAFINAIKVVQASHSGGSDNRDLVIKINNTELAREQLPALIRESQRQGFEFILRPQRV